MFASSHPPSVPILHFFLPYDPRVLHVHFSPSIDLSHPVVDVRSTCFETSNPSLRRVSDVQLARFRGPSVKSTPSDAIVGGAIASSFFVRLFAFERWHLDKRSASSTRLPLRTMESSMVPLPSLVSSGFVLRLPTKPFVGQWGGPAHGFETTSLHIHRCAFLHDDSLPFLFKSDAASTVVIRNHVSKQVETRTKTPVRPLAIHVKGVDSCTTQREERQRHSSQERSKPNILQVRWKPIPKQNIRRNTSIHHTNETGLATTRSRATTTTTKRRKRSTRRAARFNIQTFIAKAEDTTPARSPDLHSKSTLLLSGKWRAGTGNQRDTTQAEAGHLDGRLAFYSTLGTFPNNAPHPGNGTD